jgi:hypothetical protein
MGKSEVARGMTDAQRQMLERVEYAAQIEVDGRGVRTARVLARLGLVHEPFHIWGTNPARYRVTLNMENNDEKA